MTGNLSLTYPRTRIPTISISIHYSSRHVSTSQITHPTWPNSRTPIQRHQPIALHIRIPTLFSSSPFLEPTVSSPLSTAQLQQHYHLSSNLITQEVEMAAASLNALRSCAVVCPSLLSSSKSKFATSLSLPTSSANASSRVSMSAEWMPGQPRPPYLDGSAPGDFGFDPLRLGEVPSNLERFKESELIHCRWAMLAVPGILVPEALGLGNWVKAQEWAAVSGGQGTYLGNPVPWGTLPIILAVEFVTIAFVEQQRSMEKDPEKKKYPGGAFDPLGFSKDPAKFQEYKVKEIKNGRLALLAFVGFCVQQSAYPGTGPLENLATHLADPWHNNIGDVVIPRSILP